MGGGRKSKETLWERKVCRAESQEPAYLADSRAALARRLRLPISLIAISLEEELLAFNRTMKNACQISQRCNKITMGGAVHAGEIA